MKRILLIGLLIIGLNDFSIAQLWKQRRYEVYGAFTTLHYFGDIGGSADKSNLFGLKDISIRSTRPGFSAGGTFRLTEILYIKANYTLGFMASSDKGSVNERRNFAFSTLANEFSVQGMFFFKPENDRNYYYSVMQLRGGLHQLNKPLSYYIFAGFGGNFFKVSPKESMIGSNRFTSNQNFSMLIPVGIGLKFAFSPDISLGAELGARYLFSDYIDGFTSPTSKYNDIYYTVNFKFIYRIPKSTRLPKIHKRLKF